MLDKVLDLFRQDGRRERLARKAPEGPMRDFYLTPYPDPAADHRAVEYVAFDLETTGLLATKHEIVSFGWCVVRHMRMLLGERGHQVVKPNRKMSDESITIHGITPDDVENAPPLEEGLARVLPVLAGRVMIAHHARIEWKFMDLACRRIYGVPFEIPTVDTLVLEKRSMDMRNQQIQQGALRLDAVRGRYNLPRYRAHNAMIDAIACGELFLAQAAHRGGDGGLTLRQLSI